MNSVTIFMLLIFNPANDFVAFQGFFKEEDCQYQAAARQRQKPSYTIYCQRVQLR